MPRFKTGDLVRIQDTTKIFVSDTLDDLYANKQKQIKIPALTVGEVVNCDHEILWLPKEQVFTWTVCFCSVCLLGVNE